jgi:hypothetical protein
MCAPASNLDLQPTHNSGAPLAVAGGVRPYVEAVEKVPKQILGRDLILEKSQETALPSKCSDGGFLQAR